MTRTVSIQGYEGSFHQMAAQQFFGAPTQVLPCDTFRQVVDAVQSGTVTAGLMAIENSIAGTILPNYNLLQKSGVSIAGEVYLPVRQQLLVNPGVSVSDIREVHSHPMAIQQCMDYLVQFPWKLVETEDTALSARRIRQHRHKHAAAIASKLAADLYELTILASDIHSEKNNYTRFLVLQQDAVEVPGADKASISFETHHERGSLARVLTNIAEGGINLSKLQSFPIANSNWIYRFHADLEFDNRTQLDDVLQSIAEVTTAVKLLGIYKNGKTRHV